ncbi:MAG: protein kinase [Gammaproteobacteria bacterium]|nr:protein kinase [Gammaproteobacteria bacterium]
MELPGFQVQKELGRGGMARVYLAVQKKFGRLVALKVVSADFANDVHFRKRFVQESRINARLTHPNIIQVYDVGSHEAVLYLVLEYIRGGDLNQRLERGMDLRELIQVVKDIGRALDYAHEKGFVHRDIKPENILFREDGSAVLTDFGIARLADSNPSITRVGTVVGTPQYMSPEQASGRELDGRSDIYSLGIVFYRMLTGEVPFKADSAVSIGIKHLQEPIPRLPTYLEAFQRVIDRCLAKKLEHRYQTGAELGAALDAVQSEADLPNATIKATAVSTQEIHAVGSNLMTTPRDPMRIERTSQRQRRRRIARQLISLSLLLVVVGSGVYVSVEQPQWVTRILAVTGLVEDPEVQDAWSTAQSLHQDPNQSLATIVAGYRRVLKLDPDHPEAGQAIAGLANQWKTSVADALAQDDLTQAETKLDESLTAFPEDPSLVELTEQLTDRQRGENLLSSTQALLRSHGLSDIPSATAAIQAYQEVLRLAPGNAVAIEELNRLSQHYATLAAGAAETGEVDDAISFLDRASAANPALAELDVARQKIQQATTAQAAIDELLQQASTYRADGALINPPGENAAELYHRVLATDPDSVIASHGLNEVVSQVLGTANQLLVAGELEDLRALVDRSSAVDLDPEAVNEMKAALDGEITRRATVADRLASAGTLFVQGFITEPQDANVVSLLRDVQRLDPGNETARSMLARSAGRLASVAREAYDAGLSEDAKHYLELALTVTPDVDAWRELRALWEEDIATP